MQGVILSTGRARSLILGDDGVRYIFTPSEWQSDDVEPEVGMKVDFEVRGSNAADIFPIPDADPTISAQPSPARPTMPSASPAEQPAASPAGESFRMKRWRWAMAGCGALVILGIIGAVALGIFGSSDPPLGREFARHTHEGRTYALVEYGDELAIFSDSGEPVGQRQLAEDILRSYAWRQVIGDFDIEELTDVSEKVRRLDDSVSGVRDISNDVVSIFDELDGMKANIPIVGSVSAMGVVRASFPGVGEAEDLVRSLDTELIALGDNAASLASASERIRGVDPSSVSGVEMEALFNDASEAAEDLEDSVRTAKDFVSNGGELVEGLARALKEGSDTPIIGQALGDFARSADRFGSELSGLSSLLGGFESEIELLAEEMLDAVGSADKTLQADMGRWLAEPYDTEWPPADPQRRTFPPAPMAAPTAASAPAAGQKPFKLEWETSATGVERGESFRLSVRMYDLRQAGEHGGISVSFPSLTESDGSKEAHSSSVAYMEAIEYTSGLSNVTFFQPGATVYHRENNRQFPAEYLLVESDDESWSRSDDRTLVLRITPKREGEFPIRIRGWLCADEYTDCSRNPTSGTGTDQQGWVVEEVSVTVAMPSGTAPAPTATPGPLPPDATATASDSNASPSGRIAFASDRDGNWEIYVMNADGTGVTRLTDDPAEDRWPSWSPDGRRIAFVSDRDGDDEIYVMNAVGSEVTQLTHNDVNEWSPSWSPDGRRIAFGSYLKGLQIYVMNADGSKLTRLTDNVGGAQVPSWSPDGRHIAFSLALDGAMYVMNADGADQARLTDVQAWDLYPNWSPDGRRIAFVSNRDGNYEIYVMSADGADQTRLTDNESDDERPSWSLDGRRISFASNRDGDWDIYVMNSDGSGVTPLTDNESDDMRPSWAQILPALTPNGGHALQAGVGDARTYIEGFDRTLDTDRWLLYGTAEHLPSDGLIQLTAARKNQLGILLHRQMISSEGFSIEFSFEIGKGSGADGLGFVLLRSMPDLDQINPIYDVGGGWFSRHLDGFAVAFDTHLNQEGHWNVEGREFYYPIDDPSGNFVALAELGAGHEELDITHLATKNLSLDLRNSGVFYAEVVFGGDGHVKVYLSNPEGDMDRTLVIEHTIENYTPFSAYFGFVGATGGLADRHILRSVKYNSTAQDAR